MQHTLAWCPHLGRLLCAPHVSGAPALSCFSSPICLHGNIQLQSPAQKAPPPGSLPGAPLKPLRCPALPVLRGTAEREHLRPGPVWGEGAPPAHRSLLPSLASPHTGYLLALGPLLFISICDVWLQLFSRDQAYAINLAAVGTVAFGCTGRSQGGRGLSVCRGRVIQGEPGSGLVCVHMHTGISTFTHHTLHTHRAACTGHAVSERTPPTHMSTRPGVSCGH